MDTLCRSPPSRVSELLVSQIQVSPSSCTLLPWRSAPKLSLAAPHTGIPEHCISAPVLWWNSRNLLNSAEDRTTPWFHMWFWTQFRIMKLDISGHRHQNRLTLFLCQQVMLHLDERSWECFPPQPSPSSTPNWIRLALAAAPSSLVHF